MYLMSFFFPFFLQEAPYQEHIVKISGQIEEQCGISPIKTGATKGMPEVWDKTH